MLDNEPGKYASATGRYYLSCDDGKSVLVGITGETERSEQPPTQWTCPVLGMIRYDFEFPQDLERIAALEKNAELLYGYDESPKIMKVPLEDWIAFSGDEDLREGEWGSGFGEKAPPHVIVLVSEEAVLRLHLAFE